MPVVTAKMSETGSPAKNEIKKDAGGAGDLKPDSTTDAKVEKSKKGADPKAVSKVAASPKGKANQKKVDSNENNIAKDKKTVAKKENPKKPAKKEESEDEDEEEDVEERTKGLLDQPLEVTGHRERKKVDRFIPVGATNVTAKDKMVIPEGKGEKLGDIPGVDAMLGKTTIEDLKPIHRVLYSRQGTALEIKRNIRKFCGFTFSKKSPEYDRKKAQIERFTMAYLKNVCDILTLEKKGTKEELLNSVLDFLIEPAETKKAKLIEKKIDKKRAQRERNAKKRTPKPKGKKKKAAETGDEDEENENDDENDAEEGGDESESEEKDEKSESDHKDDDEEEEEPVPKKKKVEPKKKGPAKSSAAATKKKPGPKSKRNSDDDESSNKDEDEDKEDQNDEEDKDEDDKDEEKNDQRSDEGESAASADEEVKKPEVKKGKPAAKKPAAAKSAPKRKNDAKSKNSGSEKSDEKSAEEDEDEPIQKKKAPAPSKKETKKPAPKKDDKKNSKTATNKKNNDDVKNNNVNDKEEDSDDENLPLLKISKNPPTDNEIVEFVKKILDGANLEEITMKKVIKEVCDEYPDFDLSDRKEFIKSTVKTMIS